MKKISYIILISVILIISNMKPILAIDISLINREEDRIIFLSTGMSDSIILQSNGKFALVDGAEDSDNPTGRPELESGGYEQHVLNSLRAIRANKLEFIIGTHAHSDHIGGIDSVINSLDVKRLYTKKYSEDKLSDNELLWDNKEVYNQMINAAKDNNTDIVYVDENSENEFKLGDFTIEIVNFENSELDIIGENENSLGVKITIGDKKVFLGGDISNIDGDEDRLADTIGEVDLLKVGHHGLDGSSTYNYIQAIRPKISIVTGFKEYLSDTVRYNLESVNSQIYVTGDKKNIIARFTKSGIDITADAEQKLRSNGWHNEDGNWYYYIDNERQIGWIEDRNNKYYLNNNGERVTGWNFIEDNKIGNWYYFNEDGKMETGWICDGDWYYLNEEGKMVTGEHYLEWNSEYNWYKFNMEGKLIN